jgi:hypothetical protein
MLTVSLVSAASWRTRGRASCTRSSREVVAPARRSNPTPSRYLPRSSVCSTRPCCSMVATSRKAVDLCTPSSAAISVTPSSPRRARVSRIVNARSTDWTAPEPPAWSPGCAVLSRASVLLMAQPYPAMRIIRRPVASASPDPRRPVASASPNPADLSRLLRHLWRTRALATGRATSPEQTRQGRCQRKTTVRCPLSSTRLSACHFTARESTWASTSRPRRHELGLGVAVVNPHHVLLDDRAPRPGHRSHSARSRRPT